MLGLWAGARFVDGDEPRWLARLGCRLDGCLVEQGRSRLGLDAELLEDLPTGLKMALMVLGEAGQHGSQGVVKGYTK